ncbi:hypothetical protein Goshw_024737 [Gossypium schwendimanii]|uniref:Uncharacterized protein n=1 Tax=Gossypium schwendimanii TaxID=34291 RepID=A0A7J9NEE9_GOSSC|nr:hypothetical protein [Gossypium schwendimanii]
MDGFSSGLLGLCSNNPYLLALRVGGAILGRLMSYLKATMAIATVYGLLSQVVCKGFGKDHLWPLSLASMGICLVALAKLHLLTPAHSISAPLLAGFICPFVVKLAFRFRIVRRVYIDMLYATRLFFFQLSQIVFDAGGDRQPSPGDGERWLRALRLVSERITHVRRSPVADSDEDSFHTLTVLSL